MRILIGLLLLLGASIASPASDEAMGAGLPAAGRVSIAGDVGALAEAIRAANRAPAFLQDIDLSGTFRFAPEDGLPAVAGNVSIEGLPTARFEGVNGGPAQLLRIEKGGQLRLIGIVLSDFRLSNIRVHQGPLLENRGTLSIDGVRFENVTGMVGGGFCCTHERHPAIRNFGDLHVARTSFLDSGIDRNSPGALISNDGGDARLEAILVTQFADQRISGSLANYAGTMRIVNATFTASGTTVLTNPGAHTEIGNSILAGLPPGPEFELQRCDGPVTSLGHNLVNDGSCGFTGPGDAVEPDLGLLPLRLQRDGRDILTPVLVPGLHSAALDSADNALCPRRDLLDQARPIDSDGDGLAACERGAVEAARVVLSDGGANGLYFVPEHDGHYVYILDNDFNTLVIWNTFDRDRRQAWILATGPLVDGRFFDAPAFVNENGELTDAGPIAIDRARPWGRLRVELESCRRGTVEFESERPEFGAGRFTITRLASVRQLGCREGPG